MNNKKFIRFLEFIGFLVLKNSTNSKNSINSITALCCLLLALFCIPLSSEAKVSGVCSNCHTMHNSQNGSAVVAEGPQSCLLNRAGCLGCHGQGTAQNIITNGNIPQVLHTNATDLAGGNFAYITGAKARIPSGEDFMRVGHNVIDLGSAYKDTLLASPPGDQHATGITNNNFACAGQYGCHGAGARTVTDELLAIKGAHHTDDAVLKFGSLNEGSQGGSTGLSYRFLNGVYGGEDSDWQATTGSTDHNEYKGATSMGVSSATAPANNTISGFCAECHGYFHGTTSSECSSASPWLRHPTDISLPTSGEYTAYTTYSLTAPVARAESLNSYTTAKGTLNPLLTTDDIVMCLSCHRAHASPYFKLMRWDYKRWPECLTVAPLCTINGCNVCHTSKN